MTKSLCRIGMWKSGAILLGSVLWLWLGFAGKAQGTGYFGPYEFYSDGSRLGDTPEFFWQTEVKRLASDYHPTEKPAIVPRVYGSDGYGSVDWAPMEKATEQSDASDFADALKNGEIHAPNPQAAQQQHATVRSFLAETDTDSDATKLLPPEPASEFADYDRGAYAYRLGETHWADARKAWLALLDRPAAQRHYRTVWAAYMLGRLALNGGDPAAVQWFRKTRDLAKQGFSDSLGMAADSYGWEGRSEWKQGHPEKAAPLFLTQLALGDESAVVSLKALIPDREEVDGMLNYGDDIPAATDDETPPINFTDAEKAAMDKKIPADLLVMARDPLLRKLETLHVLATESGGQVFFGGQSSGPGRSKRWLAVVEAARLGKVEDAEYLGWVAYTVGNYQEAGRWLDLANPQAPIAEWLRARLDLRAGKFQEAATSMAAAFDSLRRSGIYNTWAAPRRQEGEAHTIYDEYDSDEGAFEYTTMQWAGAELGAVHLLRNDFVQALDTLVKGNIRQDAAYVAERVVTANELKAYVDRMPPPGPKSNVQAWIITDVAADETTWLRYLLARRLVREGRYAEAVPYMPPEYGKLLRKYAEALQNGSDPHLSKSTRADNLSTAAWLARYDGMELMGTEVSPDGFDSGGAFEDTDLAGERMGGDYSTYDGAADKTITKPLPMPVSSGEKARLRENQLKPDVRFHYRIIATGIALRAAALMEDNTEELADALNYAGSWADERDEKLANHCYDLIEKRCAATKLGKQIIAKHWFIDQPGPWSTPLQAQQTALHKQFGIVDDQQ